MTPFVRGSGLFEWQAAYTDNAVVPHAAQSLGVGLISPGLRISHSWELGNGAVLTPYLAGEADYAFGNGVLAGFNDTQGLAGKVNAGLNWRGAHGLTLGVDGSYGGIGASIQSQSLQATITVPL
ncbi:autotransporter outer membrane beta-barrel domain-containing protein [Aestuariivirga litoralis]|uniref:autotransporter outer membrane beta-barrel domain-containing protein n=1 Tax=Aestuariivirga litoralis TaxID=2650924 RepID=UPI0018C594B9|nr:autotransporter outer membrane beta-barrel domain-containing protein [Aestuariivirga litoralis]MBG1232641.1 autotransporter outer membrane beta-barrel domain-containing protein [Aestuariivirga litoralis]